MGGTAYIIGGEVATHLLPDPGLPSPVAPKVPLWKRLLGLAGRPRPKGPSLIRSPNGDEHIEIPPGDLELALVRDFRHWAAGRLPNPSGGSKVVLQYLREIDPTVYVRGLRRAAQATPEFYVQLGFSGCAGEAETSAAVAAHWADLWYAAERDRIGPEFLLPFGFTPHPYDPTTAQPAVFLPAGDFGYLEFTPPESRHPHTPAFEMDYSLCEAYDGNEVLDRLEEAFSRHMTDGRCRCQFCEPAFGDAVPDVA